MKNTFNENLAKPTNSLQNSPLLEDSEKLLVSKTEINDLDITDRMEIHSVDPRILYKKNQ